MTQSRARPKERREKRWGYQVEQHEVGDLFTAWPLETDLEPDPRAVAGGPESGEWYRRDYGDNRLAFLLRTEPERTRASLVYPPAPVFGVAEVSDLTWAPNDPREAGRLYCWGLVLGDRVEDWRAYGEHGRDVLRLMDQLAALSPEQASAMAARFAIERPDRMPAESPWRQPGRTRWSVGGLGGDPDCRVPKIVPYGRDELVERLRDPIERLLWAVATDLPGVRSASGSDGAWTDASWRPLLMAANEAAWAAAIPDVLRDLAVGFSENWQHALEAF